MNFVKALGISVLASMTLAACSDVNPTVSILRSNNPITSPGNSSDPMSPTGSYIKLDRAASGFFTATNGSTAQITVSKGDSIPASTTSGQYKLYLDESDE